MKLTARQALIAHLTALAVLSTPLWASIWPPLVDFPKIVANTHVALTSTDPALANPHYVVSPGWLPYLGAELFLLPLMVLFDPVIAGKAFLTLALGLTAFAPALLHRVLFGEWRAWPLLAYLLAYNHLVFWGFINYLAALPATLLAFATWAALRNASPGWRATALSAWAFLLMTIHLYAWAVLGLFLLGDTLRRVRQGVRMEILWDAVPFLSSAALATMLPRPGQASSLSKADAPVLEVGTLGERARDILTPVNFDYLPSDALVAGLFGLGLYWAVRTRAVRLHPDLRWPIGALALGALLMPQAVLGAWTTMRLPATVALVAVGASEPTEHASSTTLRVIAVAAVAAFGLRTAELTWRWRSCDNLTGQILAVVDAVPEKGAFATLLDDRADPVCLKRPILSHITAYGVIHRRAYSAALFGFSIVFAREPARQLEQLGEPAHPSILGSPHHMAIARKHADALVYLHPGVSPPPTPDGWSVAASSPAATLWRPEGDLRPDDD